MGRLSIKLKGTQEVLKRMNAYSRIYTESAESNESDEGGREQEGERTVSDETLQTDHRPPLELRCAQSTQQHEREQTDGQQRLCEGRALREL